MSPTAQARPIAAPPPAMGRREWGMLLALSVLWGGSFFFVKVLVATLPPLTIVLGRVGLAAVMLNVLLVLRRTPMPASLALWRQFAVMGLLNNILPFALIVFGETRIASGLAAILNATTPLFTVLVAHGLGTGERVTPAKAAGILCGLAGVAVLVGLGALAALPGADPWGQAACLLAALSYAFAGVYGRRFRGLPAIQVATGQVTASTAILLPLAALAEQPWTLPPPGPGAWAALLGIALLSTVLAYILYFRILAAAGPTNLLLVTFLIPASALLLGALLLGEALPPRDFAGMALIGLGLACIDGRPLRLLRRRPGAARAAAPPTG